MNVDFLRRYYPDQVIGYDLSLLLKAPLSIDECKCNGFWELNKFEKQNFISVPLKQLR